MSKKLGKQAKSNKSKVKAKAKDKTSKKVDRGRGGMAKPVESENTGYCVICKTKQVIANAKRVMVGKDKDRPALKGECPDCGTTVMRFLKRDA